MRRCKHILLIECSGRLYNLKKFPPSFLVLRLISYGSGIMKLWSLLRQCGHPHSIMINVLPLYIHGWIQTTTTTGLFILATLCVWNSNGYTKRKDHGCMSSLFTHIPLLSACLGTITLYRQVWYYISLFFLFCLFVPYCVGVFSYCCDPISLLTCNFLVPRFIARSKHTTHSLSLSLNTYFFDLHTKSPFPSFFSLLWHCHEPFHCDHVSLAAQEGNGTVTKRIRESPFKYTHTSLSLLFSLSLPHTHTHSLSLCQKVSHTQTQTNPTVLSLISR